MFRQSVVKLASYAEVFDRDAFDERQEAAFIEDAYTYGWAISGFDWPAYASSAEAAWLRDQPDALEVATWDQLTKLLTISVRQEKFGNSLRESARFISVIVRRASVIAAAEAGTASRHRGQIREVVNRNTFVSLALDEGFITFLPVYDSGIDFILYRESDGSTRAVQLKGRWTIDRKYLGRDIWVAFPIGDEWYLMPHGQMVSDADAAGMTKTDSWINKGQYNVGRPSQALREACSAYRFRSITDVAKDAALQAEDAQ